jgi:hypothetical protein
MRFFPTSVLVAFVVIVWLMGSALLGIDRLAFRDVSHFYAPLYDYVADRQQQEWVPLWNPLDHTGLPLVGETTTAVFYPIRLLVFALPFSSETALTWYVTLHLLIASITAWLAARWCGTSSLAAGFASIVYPLSGSVLFLYANPPFLVGAAWLPLALGALICPDEHAPGGRILRGASSLAMMILGGDPQTAIHAIILIGLVWAGRRLTGKRSSLNFRVWMGTGVLAACLAAPQIAASWHWSRQSDRTESQESVQAAFSQPIAHSKRSQAFQYSVPPWHLVELVTPHAFGSLFPVNRRISQLLPGDGRMWTPTLYMGMLLAFTGMIRLWRCRKDGIDSWMGIALFALFASMGQFGFVWYLQATTGMLQSMDGAVGGPYWLLYWLLPGYDSLRYPAKWLPAFALGLAISSAGLLDRPSYLERLRRLMLPATCLLVIITIAAWASTFSYNLIQPSASGVLPQDEFWGPLRVGAALLQISWSLVHSCLTAAILYWLLWQRKRSNWSLQRVQFLALVIAALDLGIAAPGLILQIPRDREAQLLASKDSVKAPAETRWLRMRSGKGWPRAWRETSDPHRTLEVEVSERLTWFGRWHLADRQAVFNSMVSIRSLETAQFWKATEKITRELSPQERTRFWSRIRQWLEINAVVHTTEAKREVWLADDRYQLVECFQRLEGRSEDAASGISLRPSFDWKLIEPGTIDARSVETRLRQLISKDTSNQPIVITRQPGLAASVRASRLPPSNPPRIEQVEQTPQHASYEVVLPQPMLLTRTVFQDGNWSASYQTAGSKGWTASPVFQVDFLQQGVVLPAGEFTLRFQYRPWWLSVTLWIAAFSWIGLAAYLPMQKRLKTRSKISSV